MAVQSVKLTLNGVDHTLTYNSSTGKYEATINAPSTTSYNETDHVYAGIVTAVDTAGNVTTANKTSFPALALRVLEKTAPTVSLTYPTSGAYIGSSKPTFTWTVTDTGSGVNPNTITIVVDGTSITSNITKTAITNGYTCSYTPSAALAEGAHTVALSATDYDGNVGSAATTSFTVDTVPPVINVTAPADGLNTNVTTLTVSGTTNDVTSSPVTLTVNGTTVAVNQDGTFSTTVELTEGTNTITIVSTDAAGKSTTVSRTVLLDTQAPIVLDISLAPNPVDAGATYIISVEVTD